MIVVTGGAGFIGSNIVRALNARGVDDITVVDNLRDGTKFRNLVDCRIADYVDREDFLARLDADDVGAIEAVFHQGACSDTTEWDGRYMLRTNFDYSKALLAHAQRRRVPFIYASSAAVYGGNAAFAEDAGQERPLNVYGYSKALFDDYVRRRLSSATAPIVGLRYFNVYGPGERHKGAMASIAFHLQGQLQRDGALRLFEGCDGFADGEQKRDFVHVDDVAAVNLWFLDHPEATGIFNVGTGRARPFNAVARAIVDHFGHGRIQYIPFPDHLVGRYQSFTQADLTKLRAAGYTGEFHDVPDGVADYMRCLAASA